MGAHFEKDSGGGLLPISCHLAKEEGWNVFATGGEGGGGSLPSGVTQSRMIDSATP